jgi:flagellar hook-length control protein FliK
MEGSTKVPGTAMPNARAAWGAGKAAEQIAVHIHKAIGAGQDRINIQLRPPELGRIEVKFELADNRLVHVVITADRPETLELLQRDVRGLERALQDAGLSTDSGSLNFSLRGDHRQERAARVDAGSGQADADPGSFQEAHQLPASHASQSGLGGSVNLSV